MLMASLSRLVDLTNWQDPRLTSLSQPSLRPLVVVFVLRRMSGSHDLTLKSKRRYVGRRS